MMNFKAFLKERYSPCTTKETKKPKEPMKPKESNENLQTIDKE